MKALEMLYRDKKWIEEECDISKIPIERVQTTIKDLVEINEAIAELEALQSRSCAKCKAFKLDDEHNDGFGQCFFGIHFPNGNSFSYHKGTDFYCSEFEAKEQ